MPTLADSDRGAPVGCVPAAAAAAVAAVGGTWRPCAGAGVAAAAAAAVGDGVTGRVPCWCSDGPAADVGPRSPSGRSCDYPGCACDQSMNITQVMDLFSPGWKQKPI